MKLDYDWVNREALERVVYTLFLEYDNDVKGAKKFGDTVVRLNHYIHDGKTTMTSKVEDPFKVPTGRVKPLTEMEFVYLLNYLYNVLGDNWDKLPKPYATFVGELQQHILHASAAMLKDTAEYKAAEFELENE